MNGTTCRKHFGHSLGVYSVSLMLLLSAGTASAGDPDGDGRALALCELGVDTSGLSVQYRDEVVWAGAEWEWAIGNDIYFVNGYDVRCTDDGSGGEIVASVYKYPPDSGAVSYARIMLNQSFVTANRYYGTDSSPDCPGPEPPELYHTRTVFKHEIGHVLGLKHADGGIMDLLGGHCDRREGVDQGSEALTAMIGSGLDPSTCEPLSVEEGSDGSQAAGPVDAWRIAVSAAPNPFNPRTSISFSIHDTSPVRLRVYDTRGRAVAELVNTWLESGRHEVLWDGTNELGEALAAGIYRVQLLVGQRKSSTSVVLVK